MIRNASMQRVKIPVWTSFLALLALLVHSVASANADQSLFEKWPTGEVTIRGAHPTLRFKVWVAATDDHREQGLMYVQHLDPDQGMLFVFPSPDIQTFWMKNTYVSLDLIFIGQDHKIINIAERAETLSLKPIPSTGPAIQVLELLAGTSSRLHIVKGDTVSFGSR